MYFAIDSYSSWSNEDARNEVKNIGKLTKFICSKIMIFQIVSAASALITKDQNLRTEYLTVGLFNMSWSRSVSKSIERVEISDREMFEKTL